MKKGSHHSPETLAKMKASQSSPEALARRPNHIGSKNPFYGKHHSSEVKKRIRLSRLGKIMSPEIKTKIRLARQNKYIREKNGNWKGGEIKRNGYIWVASFGHPSCRSDNYILRSHLIVEKLLDIILPHGIAIHHINGITDDDRPENLIAFNSNSAHHRFHWNKSVRSDEIIFDGRLINFHATCTS